MQSSIEVKYYKFKCRHCKNKFETYNIVRARATTCKKCDNRRLIIEANENKKMIFNII